MEKEHRQKVAGNSAASADLQKKVAELEERIAALEKKGDQLSLVLFSGDLDKAMAAFIIANGAVAMNMKVTIFATFWGLDVLKKSTFATTGRGFLERLLLALRPKGPENLPTSKMNFGGIGPKLFRYMMKKKNVIRLETLIRMAREAGVRIIACQMTVDLMGIKPTDLIDGLEPGGVGAFLASAAKSNTTLFL
ncbi:MAG: DsrE/DsrF/DrsH-like family protein [Proteobacteria bacterium]|nr:DsrE/DsrF/DrsH-like family protein [Pseudomonadota bacterium]MBU1738180.1 DsrE/DsrF/DrsH-like family protein [Pseudomonadota bacterium]